MKLFALALTAAALLLPPLASAEVGVSINIGQPGFYGRIDIGDYPRPQLIYAEPILVAPVAVVSSPLYLHVPPGHARKWDKHCHRYNACGRRVYFVDDGWYQNTYVPAYQERHGHGRGHDGDHRRGKDKGHGKGHGKGHDKGHDKGHSKGKGHD